MTLYVVTLRFTEHRHRADARLGFLVEARP